MTEVSLLEIEDFVAFAKDFGKNYSDFSIAALRLRIQKICSEQLNMRFQDFLLCVQNKGQFRETVFSCIGTHPRDLFRDVGILNYFMMSELEALTNSGARILIIDQSNFSDTMNFVLSARMLEIDVRARVEVAGINISRTSQRLLKLSPKEIENAQVNFSTAFPNKDVNSIFKFSGTAQKYSLPDFIIFHDDRMTGDPEFEVKEKFDVLISLHNSLVYNHNGQKKFLDSCLRLLVDGGRVLFGQRESFSAIQNFDEFLQPDKSIPRYVNIRK